MNEQIEKFIDDAGLVAVSEMFESELQKFAELIVAAAEAERDEKDKQLASCYDRMNKAEAQRDKLAVALRSLLSKCPDCGGTGWVGTGIIQLGQPDQMPCFVCAGERGILAHLLELKRLVTPPMIMDDDDLNNVRYKANYRYETKWVGLTGDEIEDLPKGGTLWEIIRAAEAILKEKNT